MRPALEKHKQAPKKIPVKRAPALQIELELPRVREEDIDERDRAPEPPGRGITVVDFYI